jgi:hypothetical protein
MVLRQLYENNRNRIQFNELYRLLKDFMENRDIDVFISTLTLIFGTYLETIQASDRRKQIYVERWLNASLEHIDILSCNDNLGCLECLGCLGCLEYFHKCWPKNIDRLNENGLYYKCSNEINEFIFNEYTFSEIKTFVNYIFRDHNYHSEYLKCLSYGVYLSIYSVPDKKDKRFLRHFMLNLLKNDCLIKNFYDFPTENTHEFIF